MREETRRRIAGFIDHPIADIVVMALIIVSIILLFAEVAVDDPLLQVRLRSINETIILVFVAELTLRFTGETKKARFFKDYWVDILSVVPFFRPLRVLRVLRLMRVFRFGVVLSRRMGWLNSSIEQNTIKGFAFFVSLMVVVLFGAIGLRIAERQTGSSSTSSIEDAIWWATMSLVAGEPIGTVPKNHLGRIITLIVMIAGLIIFATITGLVSALMVHRFSQMPKFMDLDELKNHIVICGWNRSGSLLLEEFQSDPETQDQPIVLIGEFDDDPELPEAVKNLDMIYVVRGDFTRLDVLNRAGLERASHAIVLADRLRERSDQDRDARSVLAALLIERINKSIFTSVELLNRDNEAFLKLVGVEEVVVADEYAARVIASATKNEGLVALIDELLTSSYGNQIYKVRVKGRWAGMVYAEVVNELKRSCDATLIGIEEDRQSHGASARMLLNPPADRVTQTGEMLLLIARTRPILD